MPLSKIKKTELISELSELFGSSKLTVVAKYRGLTVKAMQELRREAKSQNTKVKVVKNRLVKQAMLGNETFKNTDVSELTDQLLYVFNAEDEVAPAQIVHSFAKKQGILEFVGAITSEGKFLSAEEVKALAVLPSKDALRGMLVGTLAAPLSGFVGVLSGNLRQFATVLEARAKTIN